MGRKGRDEFAFLIDKVQSKLSGWKVSTLSQAGRICLAESSVMSIPSYIIQINKIPASICDEIERLCRDFIWGSTPEVRKHHLISWARICTPKYEGGLGFRGL